MLPRIDILIGWEIDSVRALADQGFAHFGELACSADPLEESFLNEDGSLKNAAIYGGCQQIVLEASMQHLNSVVDGALLAISNHLVGEVPPEVFVKRQRTSRSVLQKEIAAALDCDLSSLAGWAEVDRLREEVNALKHRMGSTSVFRSDLGMIEGQSVRPSLGDVNHYIEFVSIWLEALVDRCRKVLGSH